MKSKTELFDFQPYDIQNHLSLISTRNGETKLGERLASSYLDNKVSYVILGISEDIGPQANLGLKGSNSAFKSIKIGLPVIELFNALVCENLLKSVSIFC